MTWTYTSPAASNKDAVRFYVGDTDKNRKLLQDEEIDFLLAQFPDPAAAAAAAAEALSATFTRAVDKSVGPVRVSYSQRGKQFKDLADDLWLRAGGRNFGARLLTLYSGGLSIQEKLDRGLDTDLEPPRFSRDMFQPLDNLRGDKEDT